MFVRPTMSLYVPFFQSSRGYDIWIENDTPGLYDVGAEEPGELRFAFETGLPIARAMVFDFPDDPDTLDRWDQFMLGPDVLVAPVWRSGDREREVVLPEGSWESLWDRTQSWTGPTALTVDAPLDTIPVFVRPGFDLEIHP